MRLTSSCDGSYRRVMPRKRPKKMIAPDSESIRLPRDVFVSVPTRKITLIKVDWSVVGEKLKQHRLTSGVPMRQVASLMGVTPGYLSVLENKGCPWPQPRIDSFMKAISELVR